MSRKKAARSILVVGSINMDLVVTMDNLPKKGETVLGREIQYIPGGKGANQAVAASRLGSEVVFGGKVGKDEFGQKLIGFLKNEGLDMDHVESGKSPTGIAVISVDGKGDNSIVVVQGSNLEVDVEYVSGVSKVLEKAGMVICQYEVPISTVEYLFGEAKKIGVKTVLNPAPAAPTPASLWRLVDYLILNETELALLSKKTVDFDDDASIEKAVKVMHKYGTRVVIVTLGGKGVLASDGGRIIRVQGKRVKVVDTTAAGDCFVGAFSTRMNEGSDLRDALEFANIAASLSVQKKGASISLPTRKEVDLFL